MGQVVRQWEVLLNKYPDHIEIMNQLGTAYCYNERKQSSKEKARQTFEEVNYIAIRNILTKLQPFEYWLIKTIGVYHLRKVTYNVFSF